MNLTSASRVTQYFQTANAGAGYALTLAQLIPRASAAVENFCNRPFSRQTHTADKFNGTGSGVLRLHDWPVLSVSAVSILTVAVPVSSDGIAYGYQFDDRYLYLFGSIFPQGLRNVSVSYVSGFVTSETAFIPAANGPYTITPSTGGYASADRGCVVTATGAAMTLVGSNPAAGQYAFSDGTYTFAAADTGIQVTMTYDFVPADVEQSCIELIGTELEQRKSLGITSKTLRDESISFEKKGLPDMIAQKLWNYKMVVPA